MSEPAATTDTPAVRIVIVNYNAGEHLKRCLDCLQKQTFTDFEAVVIDNASTDGSHIDALPDDNRFRLTVLKENIGFAAANNLGTKDCRAPWIAALNPDAFAEPDWLENLLKATQRYSNATMFGSTQINANDSNMLDGTGDAYFIFGLAWRGNHGRPINELPETGETFSPCAAAALYKTTAFQDAGGFDERFFCYLEDVDLGFRLRLRGERCIQVREAVVHHVGAVSAGAKSDFERFHSTRNNLWLFIKNMPGLSFWLFLPGHIALQIVWLIWNTLGGRFRPTWQGFISALKELPRVWRERAAVQSARSVSAMTLLRALTCSPLKLLCRKDNVLGP